MSSRDTRLLLQDINFSIEKILDYTKNLSFEDYESDSKTKDAVERNFEIIGEASSRIPEDFKNLNQNIEWRILKDFRNFIIHEYFGVNNQILWDTIKFRLPDLYQNILELIKTIK
ncbi:hypothetical protein A5893_07415 [Pedobacter psychrophilus]|uniref:DUF86 domain-containing protein n=1 Tax=Pedobacter psychrophilus TaxID=1826909 RepID=A0A179DII4_9SPHI|nr:DUF86 domain-containing protein [Pedobacter psychrophilus]OAQ40758.1 hypothetical protein A5893_07415 [Pedobacter psychrophilus]